MWPQTAPVNQRHSRTCTADRPPSRPWKPRATTSQGVNYKPCPALVKPLSPGEIQHPLLTLLISGFWVKTIVLLLRRRPYGFPLAREMGEFTANGSDASSAFEESLSSTKTLST